MIGTRRNGLQRALLQTWLIAGIVLAGALGIGPDRAVACDSELHAGPQLDPQLQLKPDPLWAADRAANRALALKRAHRKAQRKIWLTGANPPGPHRPVIVTGTLRHAARIGGIAITPASPTWKLQGLKPQLIELLGQVQEHFGSSLHIVSGCRSKAHNKLVRGAKRSQHLECSAVDFEIDGIGKHKLASYLKQLPGRGGVGVYCRSSYVHLDIGPKREWHWHCKKRKIAKKRKARRKQVATKKAAVKKAAVKKVKVTQAGVTKPKAKQARKKLAGMEHASLKKAGVTMAVTQHKALRKSATKRRRLVIKNDR